MFTMIVLYLMAIGHQARMAAEQRVITVADYVGHWEAALFWIAISFDVFIMYSLIRILRSLPKSDADSD